jgi:hypothetical protein
VFAEVSMPGQVAVVGRRQMPGVLGLFRYAFQLAPWLTAASMVLAVAAALAVVQRGGSALGRVRALSVAA